MGLCSGSFRVNLLFNTLARHASHVVIEKLSHFRNF